MSEIIVNLQSRLEVSAFLDKLSSATGFNIFVLNEMYEDMRKKKVANEKAIKIVKTRLPLKKDPKSCYPSGTVNHLSNALFSESQNVL